MKSLHDIHPLVQTAQDLELRGFTRHAVRQKVSRGEIVRIRRGVYVPSQSWSSLLPSERYVARLVAHSKSMGARTVFSHQSAAALYGFAQLAVPDRIHVAAPNSRAHSSPGVTVHGLTSKPQEIAGIPVTSVLQTVVDCCRVLDLRHALVLADSSLRAGVLYPDLLASLRQATGRGSNRLQKLADLVNPLSESAGESLVVYFLDEFGFPPCQQQVWVEGGGRRYRPDFMWPECMIILEFDGNIKYAGSNREQVFGQQNEREAWLRGRGYNVVRTNWHEVIYRPQLLAEKLKRAFASAGMYL